MTTTDVNAVPPQASQLRLVKLSSDVLAKTAQVAVVEAEGEGTSIGRDKAYTPRIRLPVMEVSKHHCNIFAIPDSASAQHRTAFFVSDSGSTYGTHLLRAGHASERDEKGAAAAAAAAAPSAASLPTSAFKRLSQPKQASAPHRLEHGDLLRVARTTFSVHIHSSPYFSCNQCSLNEAGTNEIRLFTGSHADKRERGAVKSKSGTGPAPGPIQPQSASASSCSSSTAKATAAEEERYLTGGLRGSGDRRIDARAARKRQLQELQSYYLDDAVDERVSQGVKTESRNTGSGNGSGRGADRGPYHDRAAQRRARGPASAPKRSRLG